MPKDDHLEMNGVVKECFPNTSFRVETESGHELLAYLAGKLRKNSVSFGGSSLTGGLL